MGVAEVTTLHAVGIGKPELSPSLEAELSPLGDSSRMACGDGDPLRAMPPITVLELSPSGNRCKLSRWSVINSRSLKWMALSWVSSTPNKEMPPVGVVGLCRMNHQNV
jgi:hypothetical protein